MQVKTTGIVLSSLKYTDTQVITRVFTKDLGTISFLVRLSKSKKRANNRSAFQPLSIINLAFQHKDNADLQVLKDWNVACLFHEIPYDDFKRTIAMFLSEVLNKLLKDEAQNKQLFAFLENSFKYFDLKEKDYSSFHLWFLIQLTKHIGLGPTVKKTLYFDFVEAEYTNIKPNHPNYLDKELLEKFTQFLKVGLNDFGLIKLNRKNKQELLHKILVFYALRYVEMSDIKSLKVLEEVFR